MMAKKVFIICILLASNISNAYAAPSAALKADNQAISSACAADAAATNCSNQQLGKGLMKCMHTYKKANPAFKFSPDCKSAIKKRKDDKKAGI